MKRCLSPALTALIVSNWCALPVEAAESCEQMRDRIEQQAKAKNVVDPEVLILTKDAANAETRGKVVGSCGQGKQRIGLRKGDSQKPS